MNKNLLIMGAPGAGKGTQSEMIVETYGIPHISTGDIFRMNIKGNTELGILAKSYMDDGNLVPDEVTNAMVKDRLSFADVKNGFLLDGYPRTMNQVDALAKMLEESERKIDAVININTDQGLLLERLTGRRICKVCGKAYHVMFAPPKVEGICDKDGGELYQRADDNVESVSVRLEAYESQTKPLIEYYDKKGLIHKIDGNGDKLSVFNEVKRVVSK